MSLPAPGGRVHFVGIGGIGMSALAELLALRGYRVSGTDRAGSPITERLQRLGVTVTIGHDAAGARDADLVVYTPAVAADNPGLVAAQRRGTPTMKRAVLLGELSRDQQVVAVTGTHGKTTTTAMAGAVLTAGGLDPTQFVGGVLQGDARNLTVGEGRTWVVEADEYDRSFHTLTPHVAVVTSLEADHLDSYGTLDAIVEAYGAFLGSMSDGAAVLNAEAPTVRDLPVPDGVRRVTFGIDAGDVRAARVSRERMGSRVEVTEDGRPAAELALQVPGRYNVMNALAASAAARTLHVEWEAICRGLAGFRGVHRRFEIVGTAAGVTVVSDYAHHPTEIAAALTAAQELAADGRVVALFQPHLYTRTRDFAEAFGRSLALADEVFVTGVYAAREEPIDGVDDRMLADRVRAAGQSAVTATGDLDAAIDAVSRAVERGDLLMVMGAGDVERAAPALLARLEGGA